MKPIKSKELHLGMSIGIVCLTDNGSTIVCSLCVSHAKFSKMLNFISHISREHGCTRESEIDYIGKIRSGVVESDLLEERKEHVSSFEKSCTKRHLERTEASTFSLEATLSTTSLKKTQQELGNGIKMNIVKIEEDKLNMVEISSEEFYCHNCKRNFSSTKEVVEHICTNISHTTIDKMRLRRKKISSDDSNLKCKICNKTFSTLKGFKTHKTRIHQKTHQKAKKIFCDKCNTNFNSENELLKHICSNDSSSSVDLREGDVGTSVNVNNTRYSCTICSAKYKTKPSLKIHMKTHKANKPFKCMHCPQSFVISSRLKSHLLIHGPSTLSCPHCPATFKSPSNLRYHLLKHSDQKSFECDYCNSIYCTASKLREHIKKSHEPSFGKEFPCAFCPVILKSQFSLKHHTLKHKGDKPFKCEFCSRAYYSSNKLKLHVATHSGDKPFKCEQCSRAFYLSYELKKHMVTHSGNKPYKCEQCSSAFYLSYELKRHMVIHSGKKSHQCELCSRAYYSSDKLKRHMVIHSGEKSFKCEHCPWAFNRSDLLKSHLLRHSGEKLYKCEQCSRAFYESYHLKRHILTHNRKSS